AAGREVDLAGETLPAGTLAALVTAERPPGVPALRLRNARIAGPLQLSGARVEVPVELVGCEFDTEPDLRMASFTGLALTGSRLPGLQAGNLRVEADLLLGDGFSSHGTVRLTDAQVGGSLRFSAGHLRGAAGPALIADRIVVGGACYARRLRAEGEVRLPGARITGNLDLAGAVLRAGARDALDLTGVQVEGSLLAGRHRRDPSRVLDARGRVLLAGARVGGDLVFSGARIEHVRPAGDDTAEPAGGSGIDRVEVSRMPVVPRGIVDSSACLVADRIRVEGNLELDDGARTQGTVRLPNAVVGGYLRLSGARLAGPPGGIALLGDGMDVGGDLEGRDQGRGATWCAGQLRLVDAHVRGSASLSGITLATPGGYALLGDRLRIGGELYLRRIRCAGTVQLQSAEIGATLDCTRAVLESPRLRPDGTARPSLDARAANVGKDLVCTGVTAAGGIRLRRFTAGKSVQITEAELGGSPAPATATYALNAYGLEAPELVLRPASAPSRPVSLRLAKVGTFDDSAVLWAATGGIELEGFDYQELSDFRRVDVRTRLQWLERAVPDFAPGPYEQLAAAYRRAGDEERSEQVPMTRQRRRYAESGPAGRVWGVLQRWTVGFGYRPWLAVCWLLLFWLLGGLWFLTHRPPPVDADQNPVFNPWIFAADTLLPIVNLGQDGYWRLDGASQWIGSTLVAVGWILATTAAAGAARVLKRV
ncbi:MAG TPA: hypothetical protein VD813_09025, partial [Pseudonocardia sp.]|nr:hypothetical protein [Pseudonocardia sp.]